MNGDQGLALIVLAMQEMVREIERGKEMEGGNIMEEIGVIGERERDATIVDI